MNSSKLIAVIMLMLSPVGMAIPTLANNAHKECDRKYHYEGRGELERTGLPDARHLDSVLNLTVQQKETLKAQREANKPARDALHKKLGIAREALTAAVNAGAKDSELNALADELGKLHAEQALINAKAHKAFLSILTEEQKQTMTELKAKRLERKMERRARRGSQKGDLDTAA